MYSNDSAELFKEQSKNVITVKSFKVPSSSLSSTDGSDHSQLSKNADQNSDLIHNSTRAFTIQYIISIVGTLALFASGMHLGWVGPTLHKLMSNDSHIPISSAESSWLASSLPLGGVFGPIIGSILADVCGRKTTILLIAIPFLITWTIISLATNIYQLCVAQFISGLSVSASFAVLPMYIGEIASPIIRGRLGTFVAVQFYSGFLVESIIVPYISMMLNAMICSLVPLILICTFIWMPESPYYCLMKNKPEEASKSLCLLTQSNYVELQLERLRVAIESQRAKNLGFIKLFKNRPNRISFLIILGITSVQEFCGLAAILLYAQVIFEQAQMPIDANLGGIILSAMGVVFLFGSTLLVDLWGRRPLLILSSLSTAIPLIMIGLYFHMKSLGYEQISSYSLVPIIALVIFKFTFGIGIGPLPAVCASEMFETNFKAYASCLICCYGSLTGFLVARVFQFIADLFGVHISFYFFAVCCLVGALFIYIVLPETKGRTLEEIQNCLKTDAERNNLGSNQ